MFEPNPNQYQNDIDPNGKYWVISRDAHYYAYWRPDGLHAHVQVDRLWEVSEFYANDHTQPFDAPDNCTESYVWATARSFKNVLAIAQLYAARHAGTIVVASGVSKGADDPHDYNPAHWS